MRDVVYLSIPLAATLLNLWLATLWSARPVDAQSTALQILPRGGLVEFDDAIHEVVDDSCEAPILSSILQRIPGTDVDAYVRPPIASFYRDSDNHAINLPTPNTAMRDQWN